MANIVKANQGTSIVSVEVAEKIAKHMKLSAAQSAEFTGMSMQIANVANIKHELQREINSISADMKDNPDPRLLKLREYKKSKKQIEESEKALMNSYSGAMRVFLADVPGEQLGDKYMNLGVKQ